MVWDMLNYTGRAVVSLKKDGIYSSPKRSWISDHTEDAYKRLLKAFKPRRDIEMWRNLRESIFRDYFMQIGSPSEYGVFYDNPEVCLIHPGSFSLGKEEFIDKFASGWRGLPETKPPKKPKTDSK